MRSPLCCSLAALVLLLSCVQLRIAVQQVARGPAIELLGPTAATSFPWLADSQPDGPCPIHYPQGCGLKSDDDIMIGQAQVQAAHGRELQTSGQTVPRGPTNNSDLKASGPAYNHSFTKHMNKTAGALDCQATCDAAARCRAWTYVPYGDGKTGPEALERCCLFPRLGCPAARRGVFSGAKAAGPCSGPNPPPPPPPIPPPGPPAPPSKRMIAADTDAMLFFDRKFIASSSGLSAHVGESSLVGVFVDPTAYTGWGYPSVFRLPEGRGFRALYEGWTSHPGDFQVNDSPRVVLAADSLDGVHFSAANLSLPPPQSWLADKNHANFTWPTNAVWGPTAGLSFVLDDGCGLWRNDCPGEQRLKALVKESATIHALSADGLKGWTKPFAKWSKQQVDPGCACFRNPLNDSEVIVTGRPQNLRKTSGRHAGVNWGLGWSVDGGLGEKLFEPALPLDKLFGSYKQIYGLPSFSYAGMVVSFAWRLHCTEEMHCLNHSLPLWEQCGTNCGNVYGDLAFSYDSRTWSSFAQGPKDSWNTSYTPIFPNVVGRVDAGQTYPNSLLEVDGRLIVHASAATGLHGAATVGTGRSSIVTYELRRDGFVYVAADEGSFSGGARLGTVPVTWRGGDLLVNVDASHSAGDGVVVAVLDAATGKALPGFEAANSLAFVGRNETAQVWSWGGGRRRAMGALAGKAVRFEVSLAGGARLYSLRGEFDMVSAADARPGPERLRTEYAASPLIGLDVLDAPRFSWVLPDTAALGVVTVAYQVRVSGVSAAKVVWDSGRQAVDNTTVGMGLRAVYSGAPLAADASFQWRVRCWTKDGGASDWSAPFDFHTAPAASDWATASWIDGSAGALRKEVLLPKSLLDGGGNGVPTVREAFAFASSIGYHEVRIDGQILGNQTTYLFEPGESAYSERALFTSYNITAYVNAGAVAGFTVGVVLGNGPDSVCGRPDPNNPLLSRGKCTPETPLFSGCTAYTNHSTLLGLGCKRGIQNSRAFRILVSLHLSMPDGTMQRFVIPTDASWATARSANIHDDLYTGEVWDGRIGDELDASGFFRFGSVPAGLKAARVLLDNGGVNHSALMSAQLMPPIGIVDRFVPATVTRVPNLPLEGNTSAGSWVFAFNQSMAGVARLRIRRADFNCGGNKPPCPCQWRNMSQPSGIETVHAPYGCVMLRYGNILEEDGTVVNQFGGITFDQTDVFILGSSVDTQMYQPKFSNHGFTYVMVSGLPNSTAPSLTMLTGLKINSAVMDHGTVKTDHVSLNQLEHASRMSITDVLQSIGMDVPDRERLGWLGDVSQYSEAAMRMLDMAAFFENNLRNEVDSANIAGGMLADIAPLTFHWTRGDPAWSSALPGIAQHMYEETGDPTVLKRVYNAVYVQVVQFIETVAGSKSGLLNGSLAEDIEQIGDFINLACTHHVYSGATNAGVIKDTHIPCDAHVGQNHYFLRMIEGLVVMARVLGDDRAHASMTVIYEAKQKAFADLYTPSSSMLNLTRQNQTQSMLSLVLTTRGIPTVAQRLLNVAFLNDLMSSDENCILSAGAHPSGFKYPCFVQRAHFTGGMTGFKATVEALQLMERVDELYETLVSKEWPGFGFMMANNATVLWESWGVAPPFNKGICRTDNAVISAGWLGGVAKYLFTVFGGIRQAAFSVGYRHLALKPLLPMRNAGLDFVEAQMAVPAGSVFSSAARHSARHLTANFSIPPGTGRSTLAIPVLNISVPVVSESGTPVFERGELTSYAVRRGLTSARFVVAGSSIALEFTTLGSGAWTFDVQGVAPTRVSASAKAGLNARVQCPGGAQIVNIPRVRYGGGCSAGGAQYRVEMECLLNNTCDVLVSDEQLDPAQTICRGVPVRDRMIEITAECGDLRRPQEDTVQGVKTAHVVHTNAHANTPVLKSDDHDQIVVEEVVALAGTWPKDPLVIASTPVTHVSGRPGISLGNHRVEVQVTHTESNESALVVTVVWRRRRHPFASGAEVIGTYGPSTSGDLAGHYPVILSNITVLNASDRSAVIVFQPSFGPGRYDFYYLPYIFRGIDGYNEAVFEGVSASSLGCATHHFPSDNSTAWRSNTGTIHSSIVLQSSGDYCEENGAWRVADGLFNFSTKPSPTLCTVPPVCEGWNGLEIPDSFVVFDLQSCVTVDGFALWSVGDGAHDPQVMSLEAGETLTDIMSGNVTLVANMTGKTTASRQTFSFPAVITRYLKWNIPRRCCLVENAQASVREVQFRTSTPFPANYAWAKQEGLSGSAAASAVQKLSSMPVYNLTARTDWDKFTAMELLASAQEIEELLRSKDSPEYLLFPEHREHPVRDFERIPYRWIQVAANESTGNLHFAAMVQPDEYFVWQIGILSSKSNMTVAGYEMHSRDALPDQLTCFNLEGTQYTGLRFRQTMSVGRSSVASLWFGIQIPANLTADQIDLTLTLHFQTGLTNTPSSAVVNVSLTVARDRAALPSHGDLNATRLARLRWLNSQLGVDYNVSRGYKNVETESPHAVQILNRRFELSNSGLFLSIESNELQLLTAPGMELYVDGELLFSDTAITIQRLGPGAVRWTTEMTAQSQPGLAIHITGSLDYTGYIEFDITLRNTASTPVQLQDMTLSIPVNRTQVKWLMGLDVMPSGRYDSRKILYGWDKYSQNQGRRNGLWLGTPSAGMRLKFKGTSAAWDSPTQIPSTPPTSWGNCNETNSCAGSISVEPEGESIVIRAQTGAFNLGANEDVLYRCDLIATPFHPVNTTSHFTTRYFQLNTPITCPQPWNVTLAKWAKSIAEAGATWANIHQGNSMNPFIDYPLLPKESGPVEEFSRLLHEQDIKLKLYFSTGTLSTHCSELFALKALPNHEILLGGPGGGDAWQREHLMTDYLLQWTEVEYFPEPEGFMGFDPDLPGVRADGSVADRGYSRWNNFYVEAAQCTMNGAMQNSSGLYLDGIGFERTTMERVKKAMELAKADVRIDFHQAAPDADCVSGGWASPALASMQHLAWIDSLWFAEDFDYWGQTADWWLLEASGIPYGLTGDMIRHGAVGPNGDRNPGACPDPNRWLGMTFGMAARLQAVPDENSALSPELLETIPLWRYWGEVGIADSTLLGWWEESEFSLDTGHEDVKATLFLWPQDVKANSSMPKALVALGNFGNERVAVVLNGPAIAGRRLVADPIEAFQVGREWPSSAQSIPIEPKRGWLLRAE